MSEIYRLPSVSTTLPGARVSYNLPTAETDLLRPEPAIEAESRPEADPSGFLSWFAESRFSKPLVYAATLLTALALAGGAGSRTKSQSAEKTVATLAANPGVLNEKEAFDALMAGRKEAGDLDGPQVQFFNAVASDNPQNSLNPNVKTFISGLQFYANKQGGYRVRVAQKNGQYDTPLIRIPISQADIAASTRGDGKAVINAVSQKIADEGYAIKDRVNIVLLEGNNGSGCFILPVGAANPTNIEVIHISTNDTPCPTSNSPNGFSALNVLAAQGIIWIPRIGNFVRDDLDTMSEKSINGDSKNWAWALTQFNHSNTYGAALKISPYFQHHLTTQSSGNGTGDVKKSLAADPCQVDCGKGDLYRGGTKVVLTADPKPGSKFLGWENCPPNANGQAQTGNTCEVTMDADHTVTGNFSQVSPPPPPVEKVKLTVRPMGPKAARLVITGAGIKCGMNYKDCTEMIPLNSSTTLKANTAKGYRVAWRGGGVATGNTYRLKMNAAKNVTSTASKKPLPRKN